MILVGDMRRRWEARRESCSRGGCWSCVEGWRDRGAAGTRRGGLGLLVGEGRVGVLGLRQGGKLEVT